MLLADFFTTLYAGAAPGEPWTFCHAPDGAPGMLETTIPAGDVEGAQRLVNELTGQRQHVWLRSATGGSKATESIRQYFVFVDLDLKGPGHKVENLPPDVSGFDAALLALGLPHPTFTVATGGGFQYFWRLAEPQTPDSRLCVALQKAIRRKIAPHHLDTTSGVNQLFRVPGGRNYKPAYGPEFPTAKVVRANPSHTVTADQLLALSPAPLTRSKTTVPKPSSVVGRSSESVLAGCRRLRQAGEKPEKQTYHQWLCAAAIFAACDDLEGFINWSDGYAAFDEVETREKFAQAKLADTGSTYAHLTEVFGEDPEDPFEAGGVHSPLALALRSPEFIRVAVQWLYNASTGSYLRIRDGYELPSDLWDAHVRGEPGIERPLHVEMRNWRHAPKVERAQYLVGQTRFPGNSTLNTWTKGGLAPLEGDWSGVKGILWHMFPVQEERELILDALAFHLQNPSVKIIWAPLLTGERGSGKSFVFDHLIPGLIGAENRTRVTGDALAEKFTACLANCQILCFNELRQPKGYEAGNRVKEFITEEEASIRPMRGERVLAPTSRWAWATSNDRLALPVTEDERRWLATQYMMKMPQATAEAFFNGDRNAQIAAFAHFMHLRDVSNFNPKAEPPVTETLKAMARQTRPGFEGLIQDAMKANEGPFAKPCGTARGVRDWLRQNGERGASDKEITSALTNLGAIMVKGLQTGDSATLGRANIWAWDRIEEIRGMTSREIGRLLDGDRAFGSPLQLILTAMHEGDETVKCLPPLGSRGDEDKTQLRSSGGGR